MTFFVFNIYLAAPSLSCALWTLSCAMWGLIPCPGIQPGPPALEACSLSHWTSREVPSILEGDHLILATSNSVSMVQKGNS